MIIQISFALAAYGYWFMQTLMPTNILVRAIHTRRGLKWGTLTLLLVPVYFAIAYYFKGIIDRGGPEWLYIIVGVASWDALKMFIVGPVSLGMLASAKNRERSNRRHGCSLGSRRCLL